MQLITTKALPPLAASVLKRYESRVKSGKGVLALRTIYCPSMDLIATYPLFTPFSTIKPDFQSGTDIDEPSQLDHGYDEDDDAASVDVWRLNGQKVFSVPVEPEGYDSTAIDIVSVSWRSDGQILAILSSDNEVRLVNSFTGKIVHRYSSVSKYAVPRSPTSSFRQAQIPNETSPPRPLLLSYSTRFSTPSSTWSQLESANEKDGTVLDDLLGLNADVSKLLQAKADLPRELANIDVEQFLPKLACLPPVGFGVEDLFSTRISIDTIFHSSKRVLRSGTIDVLAAGNSAGRVHLRIFDSFEVGDIDLSTATDAPKTFHCGKVLRTGSQPFSSETFIVVGSRNKNSTRQLHLLSCDLKFMAHSSTFLPIMATKATQLQNLLRYLSQIQSQLAKEVQTAFDLPMRFLRTLNEDLVEQDGAGSSFDTVAYHALVTGETHGVFKEWLSQTLGERGVKRWEKSLGDCLELVRRLVSEGWNPVVERAGIVVSRLGGLAAMNHTGERDRTGMGTDKRTIDGLRETIDVMTLCGEDLLRETNRELIGFGCFVRWLKVEVEAAGLEDTSERLDEMRENSDHGEVLKVLEYIEGGPAKSVIKDFIGEVKTSSEGPDVGDDIGFYTRFRESRRRTEHPAKVPTLGELLVRMRRQCEKMFEQIASRLRQSILVKYVVSLPPVINEELLDLRVIPQPEYGPPWVHVVAQHQDEADQIVSVTLPSDNTPDRRGRLQPVTLRPPQAAKVLDVRHVDDSMFMVLLEDDTGRTAIYSHPILTASKDPRTSDSEWDLRHQFSGHTMEAGMQPRQLEINGRKGRRAVVVVDGDGRGYSVFDLDSVDEDRNDTAGL